MARHPYLDHDGPIAFAHRGGAHDFPENTIRAFRAAVEMGYQYIETDVHATSDGVLVAFHDFSLDRVTDQAGKIRDTTWANVKAAKISGTEPIPRFEDLLEALPDTRINIDVKHETAIAPLIDAIKRFDCVDRVCIGSFSGGRLDAMRGAFGSALCTSLSPREVARLRASAWGIGSLKTVARCAQVPVRQGPLPVADAKFIAAAHKIGLDVHVWTIDEPDEMNRLFDLGVDGIMTDRLETLKGVMTERKIWPER